MKLTFASLFMIGLMLIFFNGQTTEQPEVDLLIKNASIVDGSGDERYNGHILVDDGVVVRAGSIDLSEILARKEIDAAGRIAAPGFIDTHSHGNPLETPRFDNFLSMGVTTISLGQDGSSPGGTDVSGWMDTVDQSGTGPNILHFTGHNTLRRQVQAPRKENLDVDYIERMQEILVASLEAGSFGLTTGLEYDHGSFSDLPELVALAEPVAEAGGLVMSHIRSEDDDQIELSVEELINQGRQSGAGVHVSHIKIVYENDPREAENVLNMMNEARNDGIKITADIYPYTASFTGIGIVFPEWALPPNDFDEVVENRRGDLEEYLRNRINRRNGPEATLFGTDPWAGKTLADVADEMDKTFEDVLIEDIGPRGASAAYFVMNEDVMRRFLTDPHVMISTDGRPSMRHPRAYGSFAKIIRQYVQEEELLSLEDAVHKMSGLPARTLGLADSGAVAIPRGLIRKGYAADFVIFDPANVQDKATFEEPHQFAEGFDWVFVNGSAVIENGQQNEGLPAGVIRRKNN